jgi:hypothetical protein
MVYNTWNYWLFGLLSLSNGANRVYVSFPFTWGRKQIQFRKRCFLYYSLEDRMKEKVQQPSNSGQKQCIRVSAYCGVDSCGYEIRRRINRRQLLGNGLINKFPRQRIASNNERIFRKRCFLLGLPRGYITRTPGELIKNWFSGVGSWSSSRQLIGGSGGDSWKAVLYESRWRKDLSADSWRI